MKELRNPFKMRTSEHIDHDQVFLKLFGSQVLDLMPQSGLWNQIQVFSSAPGGGKTSLLRLFTPTVLTKLYQLREVDDYEELYRRLLDLDVISEEGPNTLGIYLSCERNYAIIEDLDFNSVHKQRMFFSLLNSRLILSMLRGILALKGLRYPEDLNKIFIEMPTRDVSTRLPFPCDGEALFKWACLLERNVCEMIDSYDQELLGFEGCETVDTLLLHPEFIKCCGETVVKRLVIMFDDMHLLAKRQRKTLMDTLLTMRPPNSVWLAQRLEALDPQNLLFQGAINGREYNEVFLESFWRGLGSKKFEGILRNIADRRISLARESYFTSFEDSLQTIDNSLQNQETYRKALSILRERVYQKTRDLRYKKWLETKEHINGDYHKQALEWKVLEIAIERDKRKAQMSLDFGQPLDPADLSNIGNSTVKSAAELLLAQEFNIPFYFGFGRLVDLSSANIEQFIAFAGEIFEEVISSNLLRPQSALEPKRQEAILKKVTQKRWSEIERRVSNGRNVQVLLEAIASIGKTDWEKGTASYGGGGGITGIGLSVEDCTKLINSADIPDEKELNEALFILSACISNNLLEVVKVSQGYKEWKVFYLNRWLCLYFGLPLQYGGWRPQSLDNVVDWIYGRHSLPLSKSGGVLFG